MHNNLESQILAKLAEFEAKLNEIQARPKSDDPVPMDVIYNGPAEVERIAFDRLTQKLAERKRGRI